MRLLKTILKRLAQLLLLVVLCFAGFVTWFFMQPPKQQPASTEKVEVTPEKVARGKYVFNHVAACTQCHAERDFTREGAPFVGEPIPKGQCWTEKHADWPFCGANLTPDMETGLGKWTDGEVIRAIREGVKADGTMVRPEMPYNACYSSMSDDDVRAVVAYLRSLPPVHNVLPGVTPLPMLVDRLMRTRPMPLKGPVPAPNLADATARAKYIITLANCQDCHGPDWKGGWAANTASSHEVSANLTPDAETGIGNWPKEAFIARFRAWPQLPHAVPADGQLHELWMPWEPLSGLTDEDLGALYDFLRAVPPVKFDVPKSRGASEKWKPPSQWDFFNFTE